MAIPKMDKSTLIRFLNGESTDAERTFVANWLLDPANEGVLNEWMGEDWSQLSENKTIESEVESIWGTLAPQLVQPRKGRLFRFLKYAAAAVIVLFLGLGIVTRFGMDRSDTDRPISKKLNDRQDVQPPSDARAVLTLADGSKIYLDSSLSGKQIQKGAVSIDVSQNGDITYSGAAAEELAMNTLSIPKGSKPIHLTLSDGTKVWLNAASSITYPTQFVGKERRVSMTGESYYEVAKNALMPFVVSNGEMQIKVLGTHFNVNAYDNHATKKITLLEGAVLVSESSSTVKLLPGQQAETHNDKIRINDHADIEQVMAWKDGQFNYTGNDIKTIMKDIERFYDVEVEYKEEIPYQFVAKISRDVPISSFLEKLEMTNLVHFKIQGKKIIVSK